MAPRLPSHCVRIASWNMCSGGHAKWQMLLERSSPDVAILCESPLNPPSETEASAGSWDSTGELAYKGLTIASDRQECRRFADRPRQGRWTIAVQTLGPAVLGIWSCPPKPSARTYCDAVLDSLSAWSDALRSGEMIVAGDFNVGVPLQPAAKTRDLRELEDAWRSFGLVSAYHAFTGSQLEDPIHATYYHRGSATAPWHIDYVLISERRLDALRDVSVGSFDDWVAPGLSDHVPIVVDLDWS